MKLEVAVSKCVDFVLSYQVGKSNLERLQVCLFVNVFGVC